jgi:hypothetical protein
MLGTAVTAAVRDGETRAEFSAFVVEVPIVDDESEFVVVSARHCVTAAIADSANTLLRVPLQPERIDPANPPYMWETQDVLVDNWRSDETTDVSVAPLRLERLPPNHFLSSWLRGAFVGVGLPIFSDDVLVFGRGTLGDQSLIVRRRGVLATHENPTVRLEVEPGTFARVRVYVVEANVTNGMSGGLVVWTNGVGLAENVALGLVHGYAYPNRNPDRPWAKEIRDDQTLATFARVQLEIEAARNGLVYVIPGGDLLLLIDRVALQSTAAHNVPNPQIAQRMW